MLEQPKAGLISRFYRQVENRLKNAGEQEDTNLSSGQKIFFLVVVRGIYTTRQLDCVNNLTLKLTSIYRWGAQQLKSTNLS